MDRLSTGNSKIKLRLGLNLKKNDGHSSPSLKEGDARFTLIQKKRNSVTDARDRLAEIAKQKDARVKINELKNFKSSTSKDSSARLQNKTNVTRDGAIQRTVKTNGTKSQGTYSELNSNVVITKKVKTRPLIEPLMPKTSLPRKTSLNSGSLTRTVSSGIDYQPSLPKQLSTVKKPLRSSSARYHPLPNNPNVVTIRNEKLDQYHKNVPSLRSTSNLQKVHPYATRPYNTTVSHDSHHVPVSRRPVPKQPMSKTFKSDVWDSKSMPSPLTSEALPTRLKITAINNYMDYDAPPKEGRNYEAKNFAAPQLQSYKRPFEEYSDYPQSPQKKQAVLSSSIISRLDQPQAPNPSGYKVVVTNLHPVVSYEDVEELFSNIGTLKSARIVRQGIAEIVFMNEDDARRSVEVYHNRQLDGQAMNVTLVDRKPLLTSPGYSPSLSHFTVPPPRTMSKASSNLSGSYHNVDKNPQSTRPTKSVLRTAGGSSYRMNDTAISSRRSQKIAVPDVNAIHHALFSGRSGNADSNLQVFIKLPKQPFRPSK